MIGKEELRKKMKQRLNHQKGSERRKNSRAIEKKLLSEKEFLISKRVMLYISKGTGEVETECIIKKALDMGKEVVLPVISVREKKIKPVRFKDLKQGLKKGPYGIYEPVGSRSQRRLRINGIDLVVVPGLAFDRKNDRLGHGKGYYDGFLKTLPKDTPKIGLGFRFQLFEKIPTTQYDISLTKVITN